MYCEPAHGISETRRALGPRTDLVGGPAPTPKLFVRLRLVFAGAWSVTTFGGSTRSDHWLCPSPAREAGLGRAHAPTQRFAHAHRPRTTSNEWVRFRPITPGDAMAN